jgi:hypothetical protein
MKKILVLLCVLILTSCSSTHIQRADEVDKFSVTKLIEDAQLILKAADDKQLPGFAGLYKNTADQLMVGLVEGNEETRRMILNMTLNNDQIRFFSAQFTKDELEFQMNRLNGELAYLQKKGFVFNDFGISTKDNRLVVNVPRDDPKNIELLTGIVEKKYILFKVTKPWKAS